MIKNYLHHQQVSHVQVSLDAIPEIKRYLFDKGQAFLDEIDQYRSNYESNQTSTSQLSVGVFGHEAGAGGREGSNE